MTDEPAPWATSGRPASGAAPHRPRKIFFLVGVVVAAVLGVFLFTSTGTDGNTGPPHRGGAVPSFSAPLLNGRGTVAVPHDGGGGGTPAVLLFFGAWCTACHAELPPLAAAAYRQSQGHSGLARIAVIGVDSEDTTSVGQAFVRSSGVTFPVAHDPSVAITNGAFYLEGDPYAVFVRGDGTISKIVRGSMSVATFTAAERALIPSAS